MIKNIVFDIGGVLIDFDPARVLSEKGLSGKGLCLVLDATINTPLWKELDRGVLDAPDVINKMKDLLSQTIGSNLTNGANSVTNGGGKTGVILPQTIGSNLTNGANSVTNGGGKTGVISSQTIGSSLTNGANSVTNGGGGVGAQAAGDAEALCGYVDWFFEEGMKTVVTTRKYAAPWLKSFKEKGFGVYLLSNYPTWAFEMHSKQFDFMQFTDGKVVSGYVKVIKPDRAIYDLLLHNYSLNAAECVFIDDVAANVEGARRAGMQSVQFTTYEKTSAAVLDMIVSGK